MCYTPGYAHRSRQEQAEERAEIHAHHTELRRAMQAGEPGSQEAYDLHLDVHRRVGSLWEFKYGMERAKSILAQKDAEQRVAERKASRRAEMTPDPTQRERSRSARLARRAARRFSITTPTADKAQEYLEGQQIKTLERILIPA